MHALVLSEVSDGRVDDLHRQAAHARRVAAARRARRGRDGRRPLRLRVGGFLVAFGATVAGVDAPVLGRSSLDRSEGRAAPSRLQTGGAR